MQPLQVLKEPIKNIVKKEAGQPVPSPSFRFKRQGQPQWGGDFKTGDWLRPAGKEYVQGQIGRNFSSIWEGVTSSYSKNIFGDKDTIQEHLDRMTK